MPPAKKTSRQAAYLKVRNAILRGEFSPGQHLPEEMLAEQLGVSRTPIREALRKLLEEGLITVATNKRCYVADVSEAHAEENFEMLVMLEGFAARLAARNATPQQLKELRQIQDEMLKNQEQGIDDDLVFLELNSRFHRLLHAASGNPKLVDVLSKLGDFPRTIYLKLGERTENDSAVAQHEDVLVALERRDPAYAEMLMRMHVEHTRHEFRHLWIACDSKA